MKAWLSSKDEEGALEQPRFPRIILTRPVHRRFKSAAFTKPNRACKAIHRAIRILARSSRTTKHHGIGRSGGDGVVSSGMVLLPHGGAS